MSAHRPPPQKRPASSAECSQGCNTTKPQQPPPAPAIYRHLRIHEIPFDRSSRNLYFPRLFDTIAPLTSAEKARGLFTAGYAGFESGVNRRQAYIACPHADAAHRSGLNARTGLSRWHKR